MFKLIGIYIFVNAHMMEKKKKKKRENPGTKLVPNIIPWRSMEVKIGVDGLTFRAPYPELSNPLKAIFFIICSQAFKTNLGYQRASPL